MLYIVLHAVDVKNKYIGETGNLQARVTVHKEHIKYPNLRMMGVSEHITNCAKENTGQGFVVSKSFNFGNFLLEWNEFKNKIRCRLFFRNKDNSSPVHPYRKSSGRPAPVGSGFESKLMENVLLSCEKEFLAWNLR